MVAHGGYSADVWVCHSVVLQLCHRFAFSSRHPWHISSAPIKMSSTPPSCMHIIAVSRRTRVALFPARLFVNKRTTTVLHPPFAVTYMLSHMPLPFTLTTASSSLTKSRCTIGEKSHLQRHRRISRAAGHSSSRRNNVRNSFGWIRAVAVDYSRWQVTFHFFRLFCTKL